MNQRRIARRRYGRVLRTVRMLSVIAVLGASLAACSSAPDAGAPVGNTTTEAPAGPVDLKPAPEPDESTGPAGGPAFEPASTGAPEVVRDEPALRRATVTPVPFTETATWTDGLEASTGGFSRGTITATGVGAVSGATYVTVEVELRNTSDAEVLLDSVVATLLVGDGVPAAPVYDVEGVADLSGVLAPGATATGTYAFQVADDIGDGTLYLDVDGDHAVATFSGSFL